MLKKNKCPQIIVATPLGEGGMGGIDRIMDEVRSEIARVNDLSIKIKFTPTRGQYSILLSPFFTVYFVMQMVILRCFGRIDLLHINLSSHGSVLRKHFISKVATLCGIPYTLHLHGSRFRQYWDSSSGRQKARIDYLFKSARKIIVLGTVWQKFVSDKLPEVASKVVILPNASREVETSARNQSTNVVQIIFLGKIGKRKGTHDLVEALSKLTTQTEWNATIAGNGEVDIYHEKAHALGIADRVTFTGWISPIATQALLDSADILILPSYDENLPMSVIEGMAAGVAVIATPVGAVADIVHDGETGLLVPVGNVAAITEALERLIDSPALRTKLGLGAKNFHSEYLEIRQYVEKLKLIWKSAAL